MTLHLLVHDYDLRDLESRRRRLVEAFPDAHIDGFDSRNGFLESISELPVAALGQPRPVALIDLQGRDDGLARGEQLIATIGRHPALAGRTAVVAFTRYGHVALDDRFRALGAVGLLAPEMLDVDDRVAAVRAGLSRLARGDEEFSRLAAPPQPADHARLLNVLDEFFPGVLVETDDAQRLEHARQVLFVCRLAEDGYTDKAIRDLLGITRARLDSYAHALLDSDRAIDSGAVDTAPRLAAVASALRPEADAESRWVLTSDKDPLDKPGRIRWAARRFANLYGPDDVRPTEAPAWIPPDHVRVLRVFLERYHEAERSIGGTNKSHDRVLAVADLAVRIASSLTGADDEQARSSVRHGILCLEEASRPDPLPL